MWYRDKAFIYDNSSVPDEIKGLLDTIEKDICCYGIKLAVFGLYAGEKHGEYAERIRKYLFEKSVEIIESGINVILDWGFWTKAGRAYVRDFYAERNIKYEFHYIDITDEEWETRIVNRNNSVAAGEAIAYFIDNNLAAKFADLFEPPSADEIDIWVRTKAYDKN